jgi:hypothetical protein
MPGYELTAIIQRQDDLFVAQCVELDIGGAGATLEYALVSLKQAVRGFLERAEDAGLWTGVVTTTTVTHATPAGCYAHTPERNWENDATLAPAARAAGFPDIARQLVEEKHGDGIDVVFGGGRSNFLPAPAGSRGDGRDLESGGHLRGKAALVARAGSGGKHAATRLAAICAGSASSHACPEAALCQRRPGGRFNRLAQRPQATLADDDAEVEILAPEQYDAGSIGPRSGASLSCQRVAG